MSTDENLTDSGLSRAKSMTAESGGVAASAKEHSRFSVNQLDFYLYGKKTVLAIDVGDMRQKKSQEKVVDRRKSDEESGCLQACDVGLGESEVQSTTHGPLQSLRKLVYAKDQGKPYDDIQPTYAVMSFPDEVQLCTSSIPGTNYGVCTKQHLPAGTWIGPYEGRRTVYQRLVHEEDHEYRWEIYEEEQFSHFIDGSDENSASWMRFIRCARNEKEQNMAAFQYGQNIYYRSLQDIAVGDELLVWYSDSYIKHLEIPLILKETEQEVKIDEPTQQHTPVTKPSSVNCVTSELSSSEIPEHIPESINQAHDPKFENSTVTCSFQSFKPVAPTIQQTLANQIRERRERLKCLSDGPTIETKHDLTEHPPKFNFSEPPCQERYSDTRNFEGGIQDNSEFKTSILNDISSPFKCKQCFKIFTQRIQLQIHVCPKSPYKPFQCGHCSLSFGQPSELRNHVVVHTSERPFKCGFCGRSFAGATTLNNHMRTHTGEKPFSCNNCGKTFSIATQLARHARMPGECVDYTKNERPKDIDSVFENKQVYN